MSTSQGWRKRQIANKQEINMSKDELLAILRLCNADPSAIDAVELAYELGFKAGQLSDEPFGYFQYALHLDAWVQNRDSDKGVAFYTRPQSIDSGS